MISSKKLIKMAKKWQKFAAQRKSIAHSKTVASDAETEDPCSTMLLAERGHVFVYSADRKRFMIPLVYLHNEIIRELLDAAEAEFGLPKDGPITLPCDASFMEYALSLIQRNVGKDLQEALALTVAGGHCFPSLEHLEKPKCYQYPVSIF
ncbi:hypothetical protein Droror1_Dr00005986 [Drosera rotundifolia]